MTSLSRPLGLVLAVLLVACAGQAQPTPTPTQTVSAASPSVLASPTPTLTASPTRTPTPITTATASSTVAPSASPTATPTLTPTPTATATATPTQPGTPLAISLEGRLRSALDQQRNLRRIPGVSAAIIFPDGSIWGGASGLAQLNPASRATAYTPFVVGSISKTFVTATIMELAEEGALSIDDLLSNWLPDYPRAEAITLRHLLSHTSGVFNYFEHPAYNTRVFKTDKGHSWTPQEILDNFVNAPYFAPGAGFHYSNTGFVLLGMVIEQETGKSLGTVLQERFLTPLGLANTYFQGDGPPPSTAAQGYLLKASRWKQISDNTSFRPTLSAATVAWAAGGVVASARDIARWCDALYGGDLLTPESLAEMTDFNYSPYAKGTYGLGTRTRLFNGQRIFGHTGSLRGFYAAMWHYPDSGLTIVVLTNLGRIDPNAVVDALAAIALPGAQAYRAP